MLNMQSKPTKESRLAMLGPMNIDDIGSHSVGTMPVVRSRDGPRIHKGHLRICTDDFGGLDFVSAVSSFLTTGASTASSELMVSNMLAVFSKNLLSASSRGVYVTGEGSHGDDFVQQTGEILMWEQIYLGGNLKLLDFICGLLIVEGRSQVKDAILTSA
ncbi:unnamed protein product [Rhodiola kirilowii]